MTSTSIKKTVLIKEIKYAFLSILQENNAEIRDLLPNNFPLIVKKTRRKPTELTELIKQVILSLIQENNPEIMELLTNAILAKPEETKQKEVVLNSPPLKKERIPYSEMPFWKANPHLKPREPEGKGGISKDFIDALTRLQESFKDVSDEEWDEWLEQLKD
jgi:hypothetical protein